jgi:hypothetical protein
MMGTERQFVGANAVTLYKCHHCNRTWQVPDDPAQPPRPNKQP